MSLTRKCLDRKHLMNKLEQVKFDLNGEMMKGNLGQAAKKDGSVYGRKSREKTVKISAGPSSGLREQGSCKNGQQVRYHLDRSKQSKESKESLLKSTHSYYISQKRNNRSNRSGSATSKHLRSQKSKQLTNVSNIINSTFEMQSFFTTHKKKKSNFSSTIGSKFEGIQLNKSSSPHLELRTPDIDSFGELLLKSEAVLDLYKSKCETMEMENKKYKKKYQEALKKIKHLESKV